MIKIETSSDGSYITGFHFNEVYYCDTANDDIKYEIEDIAVSAAGQFYVLISQINSANKEFSRVYEISL